MTIFYTEYRRRLKRLLDLGVENSLQGSLLGLEKEALRVNERGELAQTDHPDGLGSALTHSGITTDYSEAMLELITPPLGDADAVLDELSVLHQFVNHQLDDELTWCCSMPCILHGEESIRLAQYGSSNSGEMKTVYRRGLGLRYGRLMQVISGIHFNYSLPDEFFEILKQAEESELSARDFRSETYFGQLRNLQRMGWLVPYLFGASPAVCESFFGKNEPIGLEYFGHHTYYQPYATSLRMGDIGYQNKKEGETGVQIIYDNLNVYLERLEMAISKPCPVYEALGLVKDGVYQQLNCNQLQIENEYYSSVRPKAITERLEKPVRALQRAGVEYVELRSVDVNPFEPLGVEREQLLFLEAFMVFNLLKDSPPISGEENELIDANASRVSHRGREPGLMLFRGDEQVRLRDWAMEILLEMDPLCELLDHVSNGRGYQAALAAQIKRVSDPELTPSARVLREMEEHGEGFYDFAFRQAHKHREFFLAQKVDDQAFTRLREEVEISHRKQLQREQEETRPFGKFLADYLAQ